MHYEICNNNFFTLFYTNLTDMRQNWNVKVQCQNLETCKRQFPKNKLLDQEILSKHNSYASIMIIIIALQHFLWL